MEPYETSLPPERVDRLRRWHEEASAELAALDGLDIEYLGLRLHIPAGVFPPTPTSDLLGREVLAHVEQGQRVLDMGCGSGVNALLAARTSDDVVGVDVNPAAVDAARANADRNGLASRTRFVVSDLFDAVTGTFDLIVIDPPFRWFAPRTMLERAVTDESYSTLGRFLTEAPGRLRPSGSVLLFFGSSGDVAHVDRLMDATGLPWTTIAQRTVHVRGEDTTYFVRRLEATPRAAR